MKRTMLISTLLLFSLLSFSQHYVYDESFKDTSFVRFKVQLLQAVLDRDTNLLFSLLADRVHVSKNECAYASNECLKQLFQQPEISALLWDEMLEVVSLGFSRTQLKQGIYPIAKRGDVIFQAPSYLRAFDPKERTHLIVLGQHVNIREKPNVRSKVIAQASFEKLPYNDPEFSDSETAFNLTDGKLWYEVVLSDGRSGYIIEDYVSVPITRELSVKKVDGRWRIISMFGPAPKC